MNPSEFTYSAWLVALVNPIYIYEFSWVNPLTTTISHGVVRLYDFRNAEVGHVSVKFLLLL